MSKDTAANGRAAKGSAAKDLADKLGVAPGCRLAVLNPPWHFVQDLMSVREDLRGMQTQVEAGDAQDLDVVIYFSRGRKGLEENLPTLRSRLAPAGALWIGWRKKGKSLKEDPDEAFVRAAGLKNGLVDVKVLSIDDEWAALKFVRPKGGR